MGSAPDSLPARGPRVAFGVSNLIAAAVATLGVFAGLPARDARVDVPAVLVILLLAGSGVGLVSGARWGAAAARVAAVVTLALGLILVLLLALAASYLAGIYGAVGKGGAVIFTLVLLLAIPYVVVLPALTLYWLGRGARKAGLFAMLFAVAVGSAFLGVHARVALAPDPAHPSAVVASVWRRGQLVARAVLHAAGDHDDAVDTALREPGSELVHESVVAEGPVLASPDVAFAVSLVSGHDGVVGTLDDRTAYVTPDDLLVRRAYDMGSRVLGIDVPLGADTEVIVALLADRLHTTAPRVRDDATIRRIRVVRTTPERTEPAWAHVDEASLTPDIVRAAVRDAARYLAHDIRADGHFEFMVDALTGRPLAGYDWPRHAGATYFLAQAADHFHEPELATACLRAAALIRDGAMSTCGAAACVGSDSTVDVGSSALALLAFVEIVRTGLDRTYADPAARLARFLRAQQRPDGEFMQEFDRDAGKPIDVQYLYYSGEAALALSRAHRITQDPADVSAASRALAHLVGPAWSFFGDRYYFGEEHWTCQAMEDLWDRAPDAGALDFCARWQAYGRKLQYHPGETVYDADGALGLGPLFTPRLTPVASRCEAGVATLEVLRREHASGLAPLEAQQRRALALLVRRQLRPGPVALFAEPDRIHGAMPGSEVDMALRIDYVQHAGSAMFRWLDLQETSTPAPLDAGPSPPAPLPLRGERW
jgi:hypothetical protein